MPEREQALELVKEFLITSVDLGYEGTYHKEMELDKELDLAHLLRNKSTTEILMMLSRALLDELASKEEDHV